MLDITKDIQSLTTFRRRSGDFMKQLKKSKRPVVLTVKGKAAAIVQDAEAYQRLLDIAARADSDEGIRQGLDDVAHDAPGPPKRFLTTSAANMAYHIEFADRAPAISKLFMWKRALPNSKRHRAGTTVLRRQSTRLRPTRIAVLQLRKLEG